MAVADDRWVINGWEELRSGFGANLARLLDTSDCDGQVVVVRQRRLDEFLQRLILEDLPPGKVGEGSLLGLARRTSKNRWSSYVRSPVVGPDHAALQKEDQRQ